MLSVIIPVYNTGNSLGKCLDSVLSSSYNDFEVILVNDGSTDQSLSICEVYSQRDSRIRLLSQENQGVSAARNHGIAVSRGEWLVFVDSDDYISKDFLETVARETLSPADLFIFDFIKPGRNENFLSEQGDASGYFYENGDAPQIIEKMLRHWQLMENGNTDLCSPCAKAYRKSLIEQYSIQFPDNVIVGEDILFNTEYLLKINSCKYIPRPVYRYMMRSDSATHGFTTGLVKNYCNFEKRLKSLLEASHRFLTLEKTYYANALENMAYILIKEIFSPYNTASHRERCCLCEEMQKDENFRCALKYNFKIGILPRRILLGFFRIRCYCIVSLICRLSLKGIEWMDAKNRKKDGTN